MKIAIDFDGTCVSHEFPLVGKDIGAAPILKRLVDNGHSLNLFTMRSGEYLLDALKWFLDNNILLTGINKDPGQERWTKSPKCYAELYIDDAALGIPLIHDDSVSNRPFVDWKKVEVELQLKGLI
ncbi:BT0820 family HAD-type phosphatase [Tenacibaculum sp.]|uniref:BT0820 family HAD-type phosphatase n=1 Tax=Tenacibaculum sp. TaxID=1906242 RepID=UPI003D13BDA0